MNTFLILEETTTKFVLSGIINSAVKIRLAFNLQGYQLSINPDSEHNITVVIATKRTDNGMIVNI